MPAPSRASALDLRGFAPRPVWQALVFDMSSKFALSIFLLLIPVISNAGSFTYSYAPSANVKGDVDADEFYLGEYEFLSLDPGTARSIAISFVEESLLYVEYTSLDTETENGIRFDDRYTSLTIGSESRVDKRLNSSVGAYMRFGLGVGAARFNIVNEKYRALAEIKMEAGFMFGKRITIGPGIKYQVVGYPTETMASASILYISAGVWF